VWQLAKHEPPSLLLRFLGWNLFDWTRLQLHTINKIQFAQDFQWCRKAFFFVPRPLCFTGFHMVVLTMQNLLSSPVRRHLIPSKSISKSLELSEWLTMVRIHWHSSEQNDCLNVYLQGLGKGRQIATRQVYLLLLTLRMIGGSTTFICRLFAETRSIVIRKKVTI
jgi:hypothetical protein